MQENPDTVWGVPPAGTPLRAWSGPEGRELAVDLTLIIQAARAEEAIDHLLVGLTPSLEDQAALGRLNFHAFVKGYEPVSALWDETPKLDPDARALLISAHLTDDPRS